MGDHLTVGECRLMDFASKTVHAIILTLVNDLSHHITSLTSSEEYFIAKLQSWSFNIYVI